VHSVSRNCLTTKHATDLEWLYSNLRWAERIQSVEQHNIKQPWVMLSEEEEEKEKKKKEKEEEEEGSAVGDFSVEDKSGAQQRGCLTGMQHSINYECFLCDAKTQQI